MTDYVTDQGGAALGARLRRLSAQIDADAAKIYETESARFEQRWFGVINQLALNGPMSVTSLAAALGISHPSISETRQSLQRAGVVEARPDPDDSRRRILSLSPAGEALIERLRPLWQVFDVVARDLDAEAGDVTLALARLEAALARKSLHARIIERIGETAANTRA